MKLKEITIEITQQCPNYCIHCSSMSSLSKNHMMPLEKVKAWVTEQDSVSKTNKQTNNLQCKSATL